MSHRSICFFQRAICHFSLQFCIILFWRGAKLIQMLYDMQQKFENNGKKISNLCKQNNQSSIFLHHHKIYEFNTINLPIMESQNSNNNDTANNLIALDSIQPIIKEDLQQQETPFVRQYADYKAKTTVGFQRADWDKAMANKISRWNRYYKGEQVPYCVELEHFKPYGPGIYLFFVFLKEISILFFIMSLVSIVPMVYNATTGTNLANVTGNWQTYLARTTVGNQQGAPIGQAADNLIENSIKNKLFNVIPDLVYSFLFFIFYFYWSFKSSRLTNEIKHEVKLASYRTIVLLDFPEDATETEIKEYMSRFGRVTEVAAVKDYEDTIFLSRGIYDLSLELKEIRILQGEASDEMPKVQAKVKQMEQLAERLKEEQQKMKDKVIKYYVMYETAAERENVIEIFRPFQAACYCMTKCCSDQPNEELFLKGMLCKIEPCQVQPGGILWENVHITWKSRWVRLVIQYLILLLMIAFGFLGISLLNISNPPLSNSNIDTSGYSEPDIAASQDYDLVESWCLKNYGLVTLSASLEKRCATIQLLYYTKIGISIGITIVIILIRFVVRKIVIALAKFQRYTTQTKQTLDTMMNLFVTYVCTTVLITILLQANLFGISFKGFAGLFLSPDSQMAKNLNELTEYSDLVGNWYIDIGYQIWLTWMILAVSPHTIWPIVQFLYEKIGEYIGRKQVLRKNMENAIEAEEFDIEDHYANIMMIIFVGMTFCGGIPMLIPLCFIGLVTRYISFKYSFIRYCRVPKTYDDSLNFRMLQVMAASILVHLCVSIWTYGAAQHFAFDANWLSALIENSDLSLLSWLFEILLRVGNTWYMSVILIGMALAIVFKSFLFDIVIRHCCGDQKVPTVMLSDNPNEQIRSERTLTNSYKLENNPDYFEIMAIMNPKQLSKIR